MTNSEKWCRQIANLLKEIDKVKWSKDVQQMVLELKTLLWTATDVCWDIAAIENKTIEEKECEMRNKIRAEITKYVAILYLDGGKDALENRLTLVKHKIEKLESTAELVEKRRSQIYDTIAEFEMERDIIEEKLIIGTARAHGMN